MDAIGVLFTEDLTSGTRHLNAGLSCRFSLEVCHSKVRGLIWRMGLFAIYRKKYPYLLRGFKVVRPNQVWSTDITYTRLLGGFVYLCALYRLVQPVRVLHRRLSTTMVAEYCDN